MCILVPFLTKPSNGIFSNLPPPPQKKSLRVPHEENENSTALKGWILSSQHVTLTIASSSRWPS